MVDAAESVQRIGAVAYTYRGYPLIQELRAAVRSGKFGAPRRVCGEYLSQNVSGSAKTVHHRDRLARLKISGG